MNIAMNERLEFALSFWVVMLLLIGILYNASAATTSSAVHGCVLDVIGSSHL